MTTRTALAATAIAAIILSLVVAVALFDQVGALSCAEVSSIYEGLVFDDIDTMRETADARNAIRPHYRACHGI